MFYLCSNNAFTPVTGGQVASVLDCYAGGLPLLPTSAETHAGLYGGHMEVIYRLSDYSIVYTCKAVTSRLILH